VRSKDEFMCIIHDKMDLAKIAVPRLQVCNKIIFGLGQLHVTFTCMITHGHRNERYAQYSSELWPNNPNVTIGSFLRLLSTLEVVQVSKLKLLFENPPQNSFFTCLL
jgi:hypothetical protein